MNNLFYAFFGEVIVFSAIGVGVHHFHFPIANTIEEQCHDTIIPRIESFVSSICHKWSFKFQASEEAVSGFKFQVSYPYGTICFAVLIPSGTIGGAVQVPCSMFQASEEAVPGSGNR